ncbi:MAG: hypothetical protein BWY64_03710 [bacterium ADurb.Bin363]|nr:MAG: hypothetical protein BWY64_03710 [bacterium ADurb.Bin363]
MKRSLAIILISMVCLLINAFASEETLITALRYGSDEDHVRLVFDLSREIPCTIIREGNPPVFTIEFPETKLKKGIKNKFKFQDNLLDELTLSKTGEGAIQVKIKLKYFLPTDNFKVFNLKDPDRLVFDFYRKFDERSVTFISDGIVWTRMYQGIEKGVVTVNIVIVDLTKENITFKAIQAKDNNKSRETTSSMALRTGSIIAVNGGYYNISGGPLGVVVINGKIESTEVKKRPPRSVLGIKYDKKILVDRVKVQNDRLISLSGRDWSGVIYAIGAGPTLISNGNVNITAKEEELGPGGNDVTRRAGHTAIGITEDNKLVFLTVDDRQEPESLGMSLKEIADYLLKLGVKEAINMDGGDSTTMVIQGKLVSTTYSPERKIANSWALYDSNNLVAPYSITVNQTDYTNLTYSLDITVLDSSGNPVADGTGVRINSSYGIPKPSFTVTKDGKTSIQFSSMKPGKGSLFITSGTIQEEYYMEFK